MVKMTCWYVAECPAAKDCSKPAFKRAAVKSVKSATECKEYLRTHLMNSCLHQGLSRSAIDNLVDRAQVEAYPFESDEPTRKRADVDLRRRSPAKRARSSDGPARSSDGRSDDEGPSLREQIVQAAEKCGELGDTLIDLELTLRVIARQV